MMFNMFETYNHTLDIQGHLLSKAILRLLVVCTATLVDEICWVSRSSFDRCVSLWVNEVSPKYRLK